ncbi:MAG: helix-turn-helix domain-containing protein [Lachnospiraceae bacterium]|nr:helix-turn-helix domain-containing protein [Lachnospiraceae bacterium]
MAVVNNLKEIRESRGLHQEDLASATGFCTKTISRIERGERAPSAEFMLRIAAYFDLMVEDVFMLEQ